MKKLLDKMNVLKMNTTDFTRVAIVVALAIGAVRAAGYLVRSIKI